MNWTKILGVGSILVYLCCLGKYNFAQFQTIHPVINRKKEKKPVPKKPADEGCNWEALRNVGTEYTVKVQNF